MTAAGAGRARRRVAPAGSGKGTARAGLTCRSATGRPRGEVAPGQIPRVAGHGDGHTGWVLAGCDAGAGAVLLRARCSPRQVEEGGGREGWELRMVLVLRSGRASAPGPRGKRPGPQLFHKRSHAKAGSQPIAISFPHVLLKSCKLCLEVEKLRSWLDEVRTSSVSGSAPRRPVHIPNCPRLRVSWEELSRDETKCERQRRASGN